MGIGDAFRRLARAFRAAGNAYQESSRSSQAAVDDAPGHPGRESNSVDWETSPDDEVIVCAANHPGARLIAAASLYGRVQVRVCQKNTTEAQFRAEFPMAYTYGPGGSEREGTDVFISFTTEDDLLDRLQDDKEYDKNRQPKWKRLPRVKVTETTFLWATVNSKSRHFQYPAKS